MASLEKCELLNLSNQDLVLKFLNCAENKLNTLHCGGLKSSAAIDEMVSTLRESRHVRDVKLEKINIGRRTLTLLPGFEKIDRLMFSLVTMETSALRELVDPVLELKQTVTVDIRGCTISPREEFETLKGEIKSSQRVKVLKDKENNNKYWFGFETIKDGD